MNFVIALMVSFISLWTLVLYSNSDTLVDLLLLNGFLQLTLFFFVACLPFMRTKRMSYVDIAWSFGVALIGAQIILLGEGDLLRRLFAGGIYLFIGLRMGVGALTMARRTGVIFKSEFQRYQYRQMVLEKSGCQHGDLQRLTEILGQAFANMSVLALPGFLLAINGEAAISPIEVIGVGIWALAFMIEIIADAQKMFFISKYEGGVCNIGLWRYTRHPNYFADWLVWTGLVVAAVPSWLALQYAESVLVWTGLGFGIAGASIMMYIALVYLNGATPTEYYSTKKRPEYKAYQAQTSMFFPWLPKT